MEWSWRGCVAYRDMLKEQLALREQVWRGAEGMILLCEHPPVITLGRSANDGNILVSASKLAEAGVTVERIERGGDVTYHGPGQLMIYPVVRLRSVVEFLERVAGAIALACTALGAPGAMFRRDPAGVWLGDKKLAACGIHVARGVSVHGFALDVDTPASAWSLIRPCGLALPQVSLTKASGITLAVADVAAEVGPRVMRALGSSVPGV